MPAPALTMRCLDQGPADPAQLPNSERGRAKESTTCGPIPRTRGVSCRAGESSSTGCRKGAGVMARYFRRLGWSREGSEKRSCTHSMESSRGRRCARNVGVQPTGRQEYVNSKKRVPLSFNLASRAYSPVARLRKARCRHHGAT